ncbi:MAG: MFS transporter [Pseudomonadales bacterium]|nr:MFS transporter [Pseudomonadales bacterium]
MSASPSKFSWYLAGVVGQFLPWGLNSVLFTWMVAVYLGEGGVRLGIAQMCIQLPGLVFILFGGLLADRVDRRTILIVFQCLAALPVFTLVLLIEISTLSYLMLIVFAVGVGSFNAFIQPARDSILNQVSGPNIQQAVTMTMGLSFFAQIVGFGFASQADTAGPVPLLLIQGTVLLLGALVALKLPSSMPERGSLAETREKNRESVFGEIRDGLSLIFNSPRMFPVMILMFSVGVFYIGAFSVLNPLAVRDVYGGAAFDIALSYMCFMVGTIVMTIILVAIGGIRRQGLGLMIALVAGGVFLILLNLRLPFYGYVLCIGLWGMCGGVALSLGRAIIQESAPENYRARALSIYSLGTLGGGPIGAVSMGYFASVMSPLLGFFVAAAGVFFTVVFVWTMTGLSKVDRL